MLLSRVRVTLDLLAQGARTYMFRNRIQIGLLPVPRGFIFHVEMGANLTSLGYRQLTELVGRAHRTEVTPVVDYAVMPGVIHWCAFHQDGVVRI